MNYLQFEKIFDIVVAFISIVSYIELELIGDFIDIKVLKIISKFYDKTIGDKLSSFRRKLIADIKKNKLMYYYDFIYISMLLF